MAIEVNQTMANADGPVPALPATIEVSSRSPLGVAPPRAGPSTEWSYTDGFNQFSGGTPYKSLSMDFSAGAGTAADLMPLGEQLAAEVGPPTYEDIEDGDRFFYTFEDESDWSGSIRDYWVGNELAVSWSFVGLTTR